MSPEEIAIWRERGAKGQAVTGFIDRLVMSYLTLLARYRLETKGRGDWSDVFQSKLPASLREHVREEHAKTQKMLTAAVGQDPPIIRDKRQMELF